jgi:hypothetical protein
MPGFDGKQARSITRTPPKYKHHAKVGAAGHAILRSNTRLKQNAVASMAPYARSQLLALRHLALDCQQTGVISDGQGQPVYYEPDR